MRSQDQGRDLQGVQNLLKKHRRLEGELMAHEPAIQVGTLESEAWEGRDYLIVDPPVWDN